MKFEEQQLNKPEAIRAPEAVGTENFEGTAEKEISAEDVYSGKVQEIESAQEKIVQDGKAEMNRMDEGFEPSAELKSKYAGRLQEIYAGIAKLANETKFQMGRIVIGASMLAATAQTVEAGTANYDTQKISADSNVEMTSNEKQLADNYERWGEYSRESMLQHVRSPKYLEKLKKEFQGNEQMALKEQESRVKNLQSVKIIPKDSMREVENAQAKAEGRQSLSDNELNVEGFYNRDEHNIIYDKHHPTVLKHELLHASTRSVTEVTEHAKDILEDTFAKKGFLGVFKNKEDAYLSSPSERQVRLETLMFELEEAGICHYGQPFTQRHFDQMMQLYQEKHLSEDSRGFIERTKPNYESFKKLFEEIAENEKGEEVLNA